LLFHVVAVGNVTVVKGPGFIDPVHGIDAPVDEDAQPGVREPLHAPVFLLLGLLRRNDRRPKADANQHRYRYSSVHAASPIGFDLMAVFIAPFLQKQRKFLC
jgi:hypothetical protein